MNFGLFGIPSVNNPLILRGWRDPVITQSFAAGGSYSKRHNMGGLPLVFQPTLTAKVDNADGWAKGVTIYGCKPGNSAGSVGLGAGFDKDFAWLLTGTAAGGVRIVDSAGIYTIPSTTNWSIGLTGIVAQRTNLPGTPGVNNLRPFKTDTKTKISTVTRFGYREGKKPFYVEPYAECLVADGAFLPGDIVALGHADTALNRVVAIAHDGIGLKLLYDTSIPIIPPGGGAPFTMTPARWGFFLQGMY